MTWYYADGSKQVGPLTEVEFDNLVQSGVIRDDTLVWREGLPQWQPCRQVRAAQPAAAPPVGLVCRECGKFFLPDEVVQFGAVWVCGGCKPVYVQKLREGASPGAGSFGTASIESVLARDYDVEIGGTISKARKLYKSRFGSILGATLLILLIETACGSIPFGIGVVAQMILSGPLMGGLLFVVVRHVRGEAPPVGDVFSGFKKNFANLMLTKIVTSLLVGLCFVPGIILLVIGFITAAVSHSRDGFSSLPDFQFPALAIAGVVLLGLGLLGALYLGLCWMFTLPLVADKCMPFWPAMELSRKVVSKHWWATFGLMFVTWLLVVVGIVVCIIAFIIGMQLWSTFGSTGHWLLGILGVLTGIAGVLYTIFAVPFLYVVQMSLYEKTLGDLAPQGR